LKQFFSAVLIPDTWQKLEPCDILLVRADEDCVYTYQGKAYAYLIDSIGDLCDKHGLTIRSVAKPYSRLTGRLAHNTPVSYNRLAAIVGILRRVIQLICGYKYGKEWQTTQLAHFWCKIFDKTKPRYVIGIQPDASLCRAGKKRGVLVYDLQHGVIADEHLWYGERYRVKTPSIDLPDGFLCWDESSAVALRKWAPLKGIDVRIIGHPWFQRFLLPDPEDLLVQQWTAPGRIFNNNRPVILVSLQWGLERYYKFDGFNGVLNDALEKTILETADTYNWLIRLHPVQMCGVINKKVQNYLERTFSHLESVEWCLCSELPLPIVLKQVDLHITEHSSVVIEAGWMGVYSALLNSHIRPGGILENLYKYERDLGLATVLPQDANTIKRWIMETLTKGKREPSLLDFDKALHAFINEIATIINKMR